MQEFVMPALSPDGWVTSTVEKSDYLISHFCLAEYSQTHIYPGHVASLAWIIQSTQGDVRDAAELTESTLRTYFGRYFKNVVCEVTHETEKDNAMKCRLNIYLAYVDADGREYNLARLVEVVDSKIVKIVKLNNG